MHDDFDTTLHDAILKELGITEPPYNVQVESDVGAVEVILYDISAGSVDVDGKFLGSKTLRGHLVSQNIPALAREAADDLRPVLGKQK